MLIREVTDVIERFAPLAWQESYDNAGLIVGRPDDEVHRALLAVEARKPAAAAVPMRAKTAFSARESSVTCSISAAWV